MILVIWQEIPENIKLFLLPHTEENFRVANAAHGNYIGTANQESALALQTLLSKEVPIYDEGNFIPAVGITPTTQYSLVVVSGLFL